MMTDFDCCVRGHDVPDPASQALNKALLRITQLSQENARLRAVVDGMTTEWGAAVTASSVTVAKERSAAVGWVRDYPQDYTLVSRRVSPWVAEEERAKTKCLLVGHNWITPRPNCGYAVCSRCGRRADRW